MNPDDATLERFIRKAQSRDGWRNSPRQALTAVRHIEGWVELDEGRFYREWNRIKEDSA